MIRMIEQNDSPILIEKGVSSSHFGQKKGGLGRVGFAPKTIGLKVQNGSDSGQYASL